MKLHLVENAQEQIVLGKLSDFLVDAKSFKGTKENFEGNKRIVFTLTTNDGGVAKITCSPRVSEAIRSKTLSQSQIGSLNVSEATSKESGEVINMLTMAGTEVEFDLNKLKASKPVAVKKFNPEELW